MAADSRVSLAQIDLLSESSRSARRIPAPLLPVAVGLALGVLLDDRIPMPVVVSTTIGIMGVALLALSGRRYSSAWVAVLIASIGLGSLRHTLADRLLPTNDVALFARTEPILTRVRGEIISVPQIHEPDPTVPRAYSIGPKTRFLLRATELKGVDGPIAVSGRVEVIIKGPCLGLRVGEIVEMTGWMYPFERPRNPGDFDWARRQRHQGIRVGLSCDHGESVCVVSRPKRSGRRLMLAKVRERLRGYLLDHTYEEADPGAGVMAAMVLGERSAVPRAMNEAFLKTGNAHLLAASGMHVGWLALIGWVIARTLGLYYRTTALLVAALIVSYVLIAEPRPSILRAGIVGVLACASAYFRGRYNSVNALALAAVLILLIRPADLFSPAFQFTFLATIGLLHFCPLVSQATANWLADRNLPRVARAFNMSPNRMQLTLLTEKRGLHNRAGNWIGILLAQSLALSISEWIITSPLASYHFDMLAPWGWLGAYVAWFLAMPAVCLGYVTVLLGLILPSSAHVMGPLLAWTTDGMLGSVELMAKLPMSIVKGHAPSGAWVMVVYVLLWVWGYRRHWLQRRLLFAALVIVLAAWWLMPPRWARIERGSLLVWMLAVGDGTGTVIELPDGRALIYDFGTRSAFDAAPVAEKILNDRGIREIDTIFISHTDFDHFSAVDQITERFRVRRVVINEHFERFARENSASWHLLKSLRERGIPIEMTAGPRDFEEFAPVHVESI